MKMYLNKQQAAKLIELGFGEPKSVTAISWVEMEVDNPIINANTIEIERAYSIGELWEIIHNRIIPINIAYEKGGFDNVHYTMRVFIDGIWCKMHDRDNCELIDFLFEAIVKLKEEGVI